MNERARYERERVLVPVEVEVSTLQQRERRAQAQPRQIEPDMVVDWRSYDRRTIPGRWRVR